MRIKILYKKLGREQVYGLASSDGIIEIDERLKGKKHLEILVHEVLHLLYPEETEEAIEKKSVTLCKVLWKEKYRRIDDTNHIPLQDGSR
jgi:hypothetical protein